MKLTPVQSRMYGSAINNDSYASALKRYARANVGTTDEQVVGRALIAMDRLQAELDAQCPQVRK